MGTEFKGDMDSFQATISSEANKDLLIIVDFHAQWCGPCKMIGPKVEEFAKEKAGSVLLLKVDVDECEEVAEKCGISAMPTFILYKGGVKVGDPIVGANIEKIKSEVNSSLGQQVSS